MGEANTQARSAWFRTFMLAVTLGAVTMLSAACNRPPKEVKNPCNTIPADLPQEYVPLRARPAVFQVIATGNHSVTYPTTIRLEPLSEQEFDIQKLLSGGTQNRTEYCWKRIANDAARYLKTQQKTRVIIADGQYSIGTGFVISRDGYVLTNAHVVADETQKLADPDFTLKNLSDPLVFIKKSVIDQCGSPVSADLEKQTEFSIMKWFMAESEITTRFQHAAIVIDFETDKSFVSKKSFADMMTKKPITVAANLIRIGAPIPGEDVALLKMEDDLVFGADSLQDKFICLTLGDSDRVLEGAPIQSIGYPNLAFSERLMEESAKYVPSFQNGQIGPLKKMKEGWNAFEITAQISWGYSGGPVVDRNGDVVALNVGTATPPVPGNPIITGHNLAVPINIAKKYLAQAGVKPVPSPITANWIDGLKLYSRGCYAEAYEKFDEIHTMQFKIGTKFENKTVLEMLVKAKKEKDKMNASIAP